MDVSDWRVQIDAVDREILALLNKRATYVLSLAPLKRRDAIPVYEPKREPDVFANVQAHNDGPLDEKSVQAIFERIIEVMRAVQETPQQRNGGHTDATAQPASPGHKGADVP
jgi:chorismate mutase-like protein